MYGFILEGIGECVRQKYGQNIWEEVTKRLGLKTAQFNPQKTYSETVVPRIIKATADVTGQTSDELLEQFGIHFVHYLDNYGYDRVIRVLGRHLRDFLNGLDNLHEYLRFTYPKMKPPSFFCEDESPAGLTLHYRSRRKGFTYYVVGQIHQVAEQFYGVPINVEVISEEETMTMTHVIMRLHFNNTGFLEDEELQKQALEADGLRGVLEYETLANVFPFHMVFGDDMLIKGVGQGLEAIMPGLLGHGIDEAFALSRPLVEFTVENLLVYKNNAFELLSIDPVRNAHATKNTTRETVESDFMDQGDDGKSRRLKLKGQMSHISNWNLHIFLATPIMDNLQKMLETGMYINDLSMHDSSRDLVLAGTQQQAELKMALDQEQSKSKKLEDGMRKVDEEMKRTDVLLNQMIPKVVADKLRQGESAMSTCQVFDSVTILFTDIVGFTTICSKLSPMGVVQMLNDMYSSFDTICERHRVYKVETIGDAYMVVGGAPLVTKFHAIYIADTALEFIKAMKNMPDPSKGEGSSLNIRAGIHTGAVVGGVVGIKMPRYCLVGESVSIANQMESSGSAMQIHISETTHRELRAHPYKIKEGKPYSIPGRSQVLATYWLIGRSGDSTVKGPVASLEN